MARTIEQLKKAWNKATAKNPVVVAPDEWSNFSEMLRQNNKKNFTGKKIYANLSMKEYISPMSGKLVTSKRERLEEMKRYNVREVDPSEYKKVLKDRGFENGGR